MLISTVIKGIVINDRIVVINKIDRSTDNIPNVVNEIQDLFLDIATDANQLDFPIIYSSAYEGYAVKHLDDEKKDMEPLFQTILSEIPAPEAEPEGNLQMLTTALDYDNHLGYRTETEFLEWKARDPIPSLEQKLIEEGSITFEEIGHMNDLIEKEVSEAFAFAEGSPFPDSAEAYQHVYAGDIF